MNKIKLKTNPVVVNEQYKGVISSVFLKYFSTEAKEKKDNVTFRVCFRHFGKDSFT